MKVWDRNESGEQDNSNEGEDKNSSTNDLGSTFLGIKLENEKN